MKRVGVDVGGTFTDLVYLDDDSDEVRVHKVLTTPRDPSLGMIAGIEEICSQAGIMPHELQLVVHGTTVATNIVLERSGAKVGLITTEGFRDLLHIARKKRPLNFSSYQDIPWQKNAIVRRRDRMTVRERVAAPDGEVLASLDEEAVRAAVRQLKERGLESVAICFLFSFLNPTHEMRVRAIVEEEWPGAFISVSSEVVPLYREYERFSTTAVNAYVGPKTASYLRALRAAASDRGLELEVRLMTSAGGVITSTAAAEVPVTLLMSGPAAGLLGGCETGRSVGWPSVITLDVGGTSSDIGVAPAGEIRMKHLLDTKVAEYDVMVPMVDVETIGAGGGSLALVTPEGMLEVGPRSAGSDPGPICYGKGGRLVAATDAVVALGWIRPDAFFGGRLRLDREGARAGIREQIAAPLGVSVEAAALGIHTVLAHNMANAIALVGSKKGYDPRDFALVAQGGAGPMFGCRVAEIAAVGRLVIPPHPGIASAIGLLTTDLRYEEAATVWQFLATLDRRRLTAEYGRLREKAAARLREDGLADSEMEFESAADCRYAGQGYELRVPIPPGEIDDAWVARLTDAFHRLHESTYSRRFADAEIQLVNVRLVGVGRMARPRRLIGAGGGLRAPASIDRILAWFSVDGSPAEVETPVYDRWSLPVGAEVAGPAILEQMDTTTVLEPDFKAVVDASGSLLISRAGA